MTATAPPPRLIDDIWVQVFGLLTLIAGIFTLASHGPLLRAWAHRPSPPPQAAPAPGGHAGPWIVDAKGGPDADFAAINPALAVAREGETILIRPGVYVESVVFTRSIVVTGTGSSPDDVQLVNAGPRTVAVGAGRVFLKGLTLSNTGTAESAALEVGAGASVRLEQMKLSSVGHGVRIHDAELDASDVEVQAVVGLLVLGRSKLSLLRTPVVASRTAVRVEGMSDVLIENATLKAAQGSAVEADRFAKLRLTDVTLAGNGRDGVTARAGADVRLVRCRLVDNRNCGVSIDGASVSLERAQLARQRCGVGFLGAGSLEAIDSEFSQLELGPLAIKPGREKDVVVRGSGNTGLVIPQR